MTDNDEQEQRMGQNMIAGVIPVAEDDQIVTGEQQREEPVAETAPEPETEADAIDDLDAHYGLTEDPGPPSWGDIVEKHLPVGDLLDFDEPDVDLNHDQDARVAALLQARLILGENKGIMGVVARPNLVDLIDLADYILDGEKPR